MIDYVKCYKKHMSFCLIICCIFLLIVTGCSDREKLQTIQDTLEPTAAVYEPNKGSPNQLASTASKDNNEAQAVPDIEDFKPILQCFIKYGFTVKLNGTEKEPISFLVEGKHDLNQDGWPDDISVLTVGDFGRDKEIQTYIKVNEVKQEFYMDYTHNGEVRLVDLDKRDKFIEIAIFDEGPSGDPHYKIFRYDGQKLHEIGQIDSGALMDGQGKLLSQFTVSRFSPRFYSAWCEISNNTFVQKTNDIGKYLGKNYWFDGGEAFFTPLQGMPVNFEPTWGETEQFEATSIKLIDVYFSYAEDRVLNYYFVEFANGERGMLYFWIGD